MQLLRSEREHPEEAANESANSGDDFHLEDDEHPDSIPEDHDSVSEYMEQLLTRARKKRDHNEESGNPTQSTDRPVSPEQAVKHEPAVVVPPSIAPETKMVAANSSEPAKRLPPPRPRYQQDKDAVRDKLDSLRELANLSARSAIATHSLKKHRKSILVRATLTVACFIVASSLLIRGVWGDSLSWLFGGIAGAATALMGGLLAHSVLLMRRTNSAKQTANRSPDLSKTVLTTKDLEAVAQRTFGVKSE